MFPPRSAVPLALLILSVVVPPPVATAGPAFYETCVLRDTPADFRSNGALDLTAICVSERHVLADGADAGQDKAFLRLEVRNWNDYGALCPYRAEPTTLRYVVGFSTGGEPTILTGDVQLTGGVEAPPFGDRGPYCNPPVLSGPMFLDFLGGLTFPVELAAFNLGTGGSISEIWAASAVMQGTDPMYQDTTPGNNSDVPSGPEPVTDGERGEWVLQGTYPFLQLEAVQPLSGTRFAVRGGDTYFPVAFHVNAALAPDVIQLKYDAPKGWEVGSNFGNVLEIGKDPNTTLEIDIVVTADGLAQAGASNVILVRAYLLKSAGYVELPLTVGICGQKCELPDYAFELTTPGPFQAGATSRIAANIRQGDVPLRGQPVAIEFSSAGQRLGPFAAKFTDGTYETSVVFPAAGTWDVDVFVDEPNPPFPSKRFQVVVEKKGGMAPGVEPVLLLGLFIFATVILRRTR